MVDNSQTGSEQESEEDIIKRQLSQLVMDALRSDAAKDGRSQFAHAVADEFQEQLSQAMAQHHQAMRKEAETLRADFEKAVAKGRAELRSDLDALANQAGAAEASTGAEAKGHPVRSGTIGSTGLDTMRSDDEIFGQTADEASDQTSGSKTQRYAMMGGLLIAGFAIGAGVIAALNPFGSAPDDRLMALCRTIEASAPQAATLAPEGPGVEANGDVVDNLVIGEGREGEAADAQAGSQTVPFDQPQAVTEQLARLNNLEGSLEELCQGVAPQPEALPSNEAQVPDAAAVAAPTVDATTSGETVIIEADLGPERSN